MRCLPHFSNTNLDHILTVTTVARDLKGDVSYQHCVVCDSLKGITKKVIPCPIRCDVNFISKSIYKEAPGIVTDLKWGYLQ